MTVRENGFRTKEEELEALVDAAYRELNLPTPLPGDPNFDESVRVRKGLYRKFAAQLRIETPFPWSE